MLTTFILFTIIYIFSFIYLVYKYHLFTSKIKILCETIIDASEKQQECISGFRNNLEALMYVVNHMLEENKNNKQSPQPINKRDGGDEYMLGDILNE